VKETFQEWLSRVYEEGPGHFSKRSTDEVFDMSTLYAQEQVAAMRARLDDAIECLKFYAKGSTREPNTLNEFGCGCCAGYLDNDSMVDYDKDVGDEVQGRTARACLSRISESP
jgi:hypothetical protein